MTNNLISNLPARYCYKESYGSGGFSNVFFCIDKHLERDVAIKIIKQPNNIDRVKDEISSLLKLRSKHVVQVFDIIKYNNNFLGIVMEFISGQDLLQKNKENSFSKNMLNILWQISSGISDIHDAGIIHRDIKPNNLKIDDEGILKIFDFGLSRNHGANANTVGFKGTHGFSAPEQYGYGKVSFTKAIDVYAFAATVLYLVKLELPSKLIPNCFSLPPNLFNCEQLDGYPTLISIFEKCLSVEPNKRPTIMEIRDELGRYLLFNKHQAVAVMSGKTYIFNKDSTKASISLPSIGSFEIHYNGLEFKLENVIGEVSVNNIPAKSNMKIPGSCVVALGNSNRHYTERSFITFDVSNPEVTL